MNFNNDNNTAINGQNGQQAMNSALNQQQQQQQQAPNMSALFEMMGSNGAAGAPPRVGPSQAAAPPQQQDLQQIFMQQALNAQAAMALLGGWNAMGTTAAGNTQNTNDGQQQPNQNTNNNSMGSNTSQPSAPAPLPIAFPAAMPLATATLLNSQALAMLASQIQVMAAAATATTGQPPQQQAMIGVTTNMAASAPPLGTTGLQPNSALANGSSIPANPLVTSASTLAHYSKSRNEAAGSSSGRPPTILYIPCDDESLSEYQCVLRKQIELFEATTEDVQWNAQGRNKAILLGQVGIRCRYCSRLPAWSRARGAVYYSATLDGLYQAAQNMAKNHLCRHCRLIPDDIKNQLLNLRNCKRRAVGGMKYWAEGARVLGVVETVRGLYFQDIGGSSDGRISSKDGKKKSNV
jgi:hypothetical protein